MTEKRFTFWFTPELRTRVEAWRSKAAGRLSLSQAIAALIEAGLDRVENFAPPFTVTEAWEVEKLLCGGIISVEGRDALIKALEQK